jgi:hypothetical protein
MEAARFCAIFFSFINAPKGVALAGILTEAAELLLFLQ